MWEKYLGNIWQQFLVFTRYKSTKMCFEIIYNAHLKVITLFNAEPLCSWWHHRKRRSWNLNFFFFLHLATTDFIPAGFRGAERSRYCSWWRQVGTKIEPSWHPVDVVNNYQKRDIYNINELARLLANSFVLDYQAFLYSYIHILFQSTYHKIKKKYYICILYDMLRLWQRVQWGQNYPESWNRKCRLLASR